LKELKPKRVEIGKNEEQSLPNDLQCIKRAHCYLDMKSKIKRGGGERESKGSIILFERGNDEIRPLPGRRIHGRERERERERRTRWMFAVVGGVKKKRCRGD
jgi:hypothetical protein